MDSKSKKILLFILVFTFIFQITLLVFMPTIPAQADDKKEKGIKFNPQISIPGSDFQHSDDPKKYMTITPTTLGKYIKGIYTYAIGVVGILSTAVIIFGGFLWATAAGNNSRVDNAKTWIGSALTGLVLALFSYTLLYMINPALVELKSIDPRKAGVMVTCCDSKTGGKPAVAKKPITNPIQYECPDSQKCAKGDVCEKFGDGYSCDDPIICCDVNNGPCTYDYKTRSCPQACTEKCTDGKTCEAASWWTGLECPQDSNYCCYDVPEY